MNKGLSRIVKTGYGLGLLSLEKAKKVVGQVKRDLGLNEKESLALARELMTSSEKAACDVLKTVDKNFSSALVKSRLVKKKELEKAKQKVKNKLVQEWEKRYGRKRKGR